MILNFFICSLPTIVSSFVKSPFKSLIYLFLFFCLISSKSFLKNIVSLQVLCQIFESVLPVFVLPFHSLKAVFFRANIFNFDEV